MTPKHFLFLSNLEHKTYMCHCGCCNSPALWYFYKPCPCGFSLKKWVGQEKALASAGHVSPCTPQNPGCNKLALCEKLKLPVCLTSQHAILGGLWYVLIINEKFYKISFLSLILAMVIFCFPPISMKGTASNICKTSVYRAVYRGINDEQAIIYA